MEKSVVMSIAINNPTGPIWEEAPKYLFARLTEMGWTKIKVRTQELKDGGKVLITKHLTFADDSGFLGSVSVNSGVTFDSTKNGVDLYTKASALFKSL